jgi:hypothetical protein
MISTILTLYDDESSKKKYEVMNMYEIMMDDGRNFNDDFLDQLERMMKFGGKYRISVDEIND